ncbi:MAG: 50S ribosomal protein L10 [Deltaproteobacteria bacterium RBG_16_42_7]|nr:MAG: 50S ribosomal protein L10 [Deltaproteobacteria bacterium RBG_16_42_7]
MDKEKKKQVVTELHDKFARATGIIFTDFKGLTVEEISQLRRQLRGSSLEYKVVKNTLAKKASDGTIMEVVKDAFTGPVGIAIGYDEPVSLTKRVLEFIKSNEKLKLKGGIIEGKTCKIEDIKAISELPSKEVLLAMLIGAMQSPLNKLATALNATVTHFAYAMEALKNKKLKAES